MNDQPFSPEENDESRYAPPEFYAPSEDAVDDEPLPVVDEDLSSETVVEDSAPTDGVYDDDYLAEPDTDDEVEAVYETPPLADLPPLELDVESALAAVYGLDDVIAEQEAIEQAEYEAREAYERAVREDEARRVEVQAEPMSLPEPLSLERGSLAALLPGLALVAVGVWLTFAYTTGNAPSGLVVGLALAGVSVLMLLAAWLASGRWNRGALFLALWALLSAGASWYALTLAAVPVLLPVLVLALGGAFLLTGLLARPRSGNFALPGVLLLVAGGVALLVTFGVVPAVVVNTLGGAWIAVAVVVGLLLLFALVKRVRG